MEQKQVISNKDLRNFGFIWAFIFSVIGLWPLKSGGDLRAWAMFASGFFAAVALIAPITLKQFYVVWVKVGNVIGKINSKIIIMILFVLVFIPFGVILRLMGKDLLGKKIDKSAKTYWIERETKPGSMNNQF